jgi:formylglycine-generating enzyme required for sulfatase activity
MLLVSFDEETGSSIHTLSLENQELTEIYQNAQAASWSPDGSDIVITSYQPPDILIIGSEGEQRTIAHIEGRFPLAVKWSPDGGHIVVGSSHSSSLTKITALHLISLETGKVTPIVAYAVDKYIYAPNWSPKGERLLYTTTDINRIRQGDTPYADLWVYNLTSGEIQRLTTGDFHDGMGVWSPSTVPTATEAPTFSSGDIRTRPVDGIVMVYVPGGEFEMGNDADEDGRERPQHTVTLDGFWIDRTEVTNAQFVEFVEDTGYETDAERMGQGATVPEGGTGWELIEGADWRHPEGSGTDVGDRMDHPVVLVSWNDAAAYCEWAGGQLPTEAEWEYAARGPEGHIYPWGDSFDSMLLNFCDANCPFDWRDSQYDDGYATTAPVGSYPGGASWIGALDMAGNILEWVADWYGDYPSESQVNPTGPSSGESRTLHGNGWFVHPDQVNSTWRAGHPPDDASSSSGFRCAMSSE